MSEKYLLGATKDNELVFGEFGVTTRNGYPEFTASFCTVRPFPASEVDAYSYYENLVEDGGVYDDAQLYHFCKKWNCRPDELVDEMIEHMGDSPADIRDCSLYPETIEIDDEEWFFESCGGGQHDTRKEMDVYTDVACYNVLHLLWDDYHLKQVDENVIKTVENLKTQLEKIDTTEWITSFIKTMNE